MRTIGIDPLMYSPESQRRPIRMPAASLPGAIVLDVVPVMAVLFTYSVPM